MTNNINPMPYHPGAILKDFLKKNNISSQTFAKKAGYSDEYVELLLSGKIKFDAHVATQVAEGTGVASVRWLEHQHLHDEWAERNKDKIDKELNLGQEIFGLFGNMVPIDVVYAILNTKSFEDKQTVLDRIKVIHQQYSTDIMR